MVYAKKTDWQDKAAIILRAEKLQEKMLKNKRNFTGADFTLLYRLIYSYEGFSREQLEAAAQSCALSMQSRA